MHILCAGSFTPSSSNGIFKNSYFNIMGPWMYICDRTVMQEISVQASCMAKIFHLDSSHFLRYFFSLLFNYTCFGSPFVSFLFSNEKPNSSLCKYLNVLLLFSFPPYSHVGAGVCFVWHGTITRRRTGSSLQAGHSREIKPNDLKPNIHSQKYTTNILRRVQQPHTWKATKLYRTPSTTNILRIQKRDNL